MAWWQYVTVVWGLFLTLVGLLAWGRARRANRLEQRIALHGWSSWRWSQDGWVRQCKLCKAVQYGGDDHDGGPDARGHVEA